MQRSLVGSEMCIRDRGITAFKKGVNDSKKELEEETSEAAKDITPETEKDKV